VGNLRAMNWHDAMSIDMIRVAVDPERGADPTVTFPGLDRLPRVGEVAISQALGQAMSADPALARAIPGSRFASIDQDALVSSEQELAVIGVTQQALRRGDEAR